jgi:phospholipid/cholesterol/gamma-HCH transport system substrate-binding protein
LVRNLNNLGPTVKGLADVGPDIDTALAALTVFPFTQNFVDRAVRGDYFNLHVQLDLSIPRLKRGLLLGTHWGQLGEQQIPAPGDPPYLAYTRDPFHGGFGPPPGAPPQPGPPAPAAQPNLQFSAPLPGPAAAPPGAPAPGPVAPNAAPPPGIPPTEGGR